MVEEEILDGWKHYQKWLNISAETFSKKKLGGEEIFLREKTGDKIFFEKIKEANTFLLQHVENQDFIFQKKAISEVKM